MSMLDKQTPSNLIQGINKELNFQQPNQVTFALNTIKNTHDGGKFEYQSEPGNELVESLPEGYTLIGNIYGINNEVYLFGAQPSGTSLIGIFKEGKFTTIVSLVNLGFNAEYPITGEFRIRNGCERVIYWCDGYNSDKWFNFDDTDAFKDGINWDPNKFNFVPQIIPPKIDLVSVNDYGGQLELGSYYFQLEVLDSNQNLIYKTDLTPQTVIYNESQTDMYYNIDGGLNYPQYDTIIGGLPITNKSITLRFFNLDTQFSYLRVNVAKQIVGTQVISSHTVAQLIPITSSEINWTYIGYNVNNGDSPIDYSSMLVNNEVYKSAYVMEQVQNRLLKANLRKTVRDYSEYQKKASLITAQWISKVFDLEKATDNTQPALSESGSPKNPRTYWDSTTFQGDEIYALSIRYLHGDGTWSPCFPLIGRNAFASDIEELTVISNGSVLGGTDVWESDVEHLPSSEFSFWNGDYIGSQIPRWKVFNTATSTGTRGDFAFYECDATYPNIQSCDSELVWGSDADGNEIFLDTKIRLFKFPDRKIKEHFLKADVDGVYTSLGYAFGIEFDNIEYPAADIIGHQFCYAKREDTDKTVVDSGWMAKPLLNADGEIVLGHVFRSTETGHNYGRYNSTNILFNKTLFNPDYVKINKAYRGDSESVLEADYFQYPSTLNTDNGTLSINMFHLDYYTLADIERTNYNVIDNIYIEPRSVTLNSLFSTQINAFGGLTGDSVLEFSYELEDIDGLLGAEVNSDLDPDPLQYELNMYYAYKKVNNKPFERVTDLNYVYINFNYIDSTDAEDNQIWGGDTLIVQSAALRETRREFGENPADQKWDVIWYKMFWEEQHINTSLRHGGIEPLYTYYKGDYDTQHFVYKISELGDTGRYILFPRETVVETTFQIERTIPEYYAYNKDYNKQTAEQYKTTLPFNYDYCSTCSGIYTNRIIFSPKSFDEEEFDLYRVNKTNDYIDIPGHRGAITGLKYKNNQLLVHCEDGSFILRPNPQSLATDVDSVYLTTGDFLSIPPSELIQTDVGYAGCQSKQHQCDTPMGWCWLDQRRGDIFVFNNDLNNIGKIGLEQWFKSNLPSETKNAVWQAYEEPYIHTATTSSKGVGVIMYYDPRFKRLIISKKDYLPINLQLRIGDPGLYYFTESDLWEYTVGDFGFQVVFGHQTYFENKSWTLSFGFDDNQWWSWHSYRPSYAFSDEINYYTINFEELAANRIWRHKDKQNFQKYYNLKHDMIIEWMVFDLETDNHYGLNYTGYSLLWDATNRQWKTVDATFNKGIFYNFDQSSGLVNLTLQNQHTNPYQNITLSPTTKYVIKTDQNYKISGIYDIATGTPVMTNAWNLVKLYGSYIDLVPNTTNLDSTQSNYYTGSLWDKFVINRLFYKPAEDYKKVLILSATKEYKSIR